MPFLKPAISYTITSFIYNKNQVECFKERTGFDIVF